MRIKTADESPPFFHAAGAMVALLPAIFSTPYMYGNYR
jgi:hypothetical protein